MDNMPELSFAPKYIVVKEMCRRMIKTGQFKPGDKFPTEPDLMKEYNVSSITVRNAVKGLVNEGLLYRTQGRGTFVRDPSEKKEKTIGIIIFSVAEGVFPELVL